MMHVGPTVNNWIDVIMKTFSLNVKMDVFIQHWEKWAQYVKPLRPDFVIIMNWGNIRIFLFIPFCFLFNVQISHCNMKPNCYKHVITYIFILCVFIHICPLKTIYFFYKILSFLYLCFGNVLYIFHIACISICLWMKKQCTMKLNKEDLFIMHV